VHAVRGVVIMQDHGDIQNPNATRLSSHGIPGALEVEQEALFQGEARLLRTGRIAAWMQQVASQPTWLVISACFSGRHLPGLTQPRLLTMTAAAYNRPSFGC
jgi:Peptidase C13 family